MLNQNTIKVFKSMAGIYQDHYPVSPELQGCASAVMPTGHDLNHKLNKLYHLPGQYLISTQA